MDKFSVVVNGLGNVAVGCVQHQGAREQQEDSVGFTPVNGDPMDRSEERRVGKECRSRWSPYH